MQYHMRPHTQAPTSRDVSDKGWSYATGAPFQESHDAIELAHAAQPILFWWRGREEAEAGRQFEPVPPQRCRILSGRTAAAESTIIQIRHRAGKIWQPAKVIRPAWAPAAGLVSQVTRYVCEAYNAPNRQKTVTCQGGRARGRNLAAAGARGRANLKDGPLACHTTHKATRS